MATSICDVTKTTIHRWMDDAEAKGRPLGVKTPAGYLVGLERLLDYIEREQDLHARSKARTRAAQLAKVWWNSELPVRAIEGN